VTVVIFICNCYFLPDTYVMKLFDRSVDLAQFEEDSPLYPICRAWMRNQPHNKNLAPQNRSPTPERQIPPAYEDVKKASYIYVFFVLKYIFCKYLILRFCISYDYSI